MKKTIFTVVLLIITFAWSLPVGASEGEVTVKIDEEKYNFDNTPVIIEGTTFIPMRALFEALGAEVDWVSETNTAIGSWGDFELHLPAENNFIWLIVEDDRSIISDVEVRLIEDRTYLPLRLLSELLGYGVEWEGKTRTIFITSKSEVVSLNIENKNISILEEVSIEKGEASWYGPGFHGNYTANGEVYDMYAYTAAHRTLPFGTLVEVTFLQTGKSILVRINDRGPFKEGRIIDLSKGAAEAVGLSGIGQVELKIYGEN